MPLDPETLARSIVHAGSPEAWAPLFKRLSAGENIVLGVFGASVAQNGGCLDQPYKRCMRYDGVHSTFMRWGKPRIRPFKGFAVRMLEHINASFPHARHQINNSALDATPAQNALPCLFSHLPTALDVVVLEFGSMAFHLHHAAVEGAARMLLSLNPRPLLIFISMHEWCQRHKDRPRTLYEPGERLRGGYIYPDTPWARAEASANKVCERYGQACLSMHKALEPNVRRRQEGFALSDVVGEDCLHPTHGVHGAEYVAEVLSNAFDRARQRYLASGGGGGPTAARPVPSPSSLPPALYEENGAIGAQTSRCYGFVRAADYRKTFGQSSMYRALQPIGWTSAFCSQPGEWVRTAAEQREAAADTADAAVHSLAHFRYPSARSVGTSGGQPCAIPPRPATCPRGGFGGSARAANVLRHFLQSPPRTWFWCYSSLATNPAHQKKSPGVLALVPGATLHFPIDARMANAANPTVANRSGGGGVRVAIEHLVSYEHMGIVTVRCLGQCSCDLQRIDAHSTAAHRNVSVFLQHSFTLRGAGDSCALQVQVLPQTSSGGYKFKLRTVTLTAGAAP